MAILEVQEAVMQKLYEMPGNLPTAFEGISFEGAGREMYQRLQFNILPPDDPTFGTYYHRENVEVQIFVVDRLEKGTSPALEYAQKLKKHFHKGLTLEEDGVRMHILRTPRISSAAILLDRLVIPVLIPLTAEVTAS